MDENKNLKSGEFLIKDIEAANIFIPEEFGEEQQMIAQTCRDFLEAEVFPNLDALDKGNRELMKGILRKAGELGMLGISIPEEYGGFGQDFRTQMLVAEKTGAGYSFAVAYQCHCGIGTMPIMYYGNEDQRQRYVTRLATGELIGAYCLTEPGAGSDANSGKTRATLSTISLMDKKCGLPTEALPTRRWCSQKLITTASLARSSWSTIGPAW